MVHNNSALWLVAAAGTLAPYWKKGRITEQVQNENRRKSWTIICPVHPGYRPHCMLCAQRRSAPERACTRGGGTKRVFFSTTLTETNYVYRAQRTEKRPGGTYRPTTDNKSYTWRAQPCDNHLKERFLSFCFCLFICFYLPSAFLVFSFLLIVFLLSAFLSILRHFSIRRYARGTRFTDTPWLDGITFFGKTTTTTTSTRLHKNGTLIIYFFVSSLFVS